LEDIPLGMDNDNAIHELKVYPNPATSNAQVEFVLNEPATIMIELYNIQGQLVNTILASTALQAGSYSQQIETHLLEKGIYYLRYSSNHQVQNMQLSILPH
jgi:predicted transcriptional regulator YheO